MHYRFDLIYFHRTGFAYLGGIVSYVVAWIVFGQSSDTELSSNSWKDFTVIILVF